MKDRCKSHITKKKIEKDCNIYQRRKWRGYEILDVIWILQLIYFLHLMQIVQKL